MWEGDNRFPFALAATKDNYELMMELAGYGEKPITARRIEFRASKKKPYEDRLKNFYNEHRNKRRRHLWPNAYLHGRQLRPRAYAYRC